MKHLNIVPISHPGTFIKLELEARDWSQRDLAFIIGQTEQQLNPLLTGKRAITPDMARLLSEAFDISPQFFLNLQGQYDLQGAKEPDPAVRTRAELQAQYPIRDMIRRSWIQDGEASLLKIQIDRFFERSNDQINDSVAFAAKKTHYGKTPPHQLAWVFRVRQLSTYIKVERFSPENLRAALPKIRSLLVDPEATRLVPKILADCGVRFLIVEVLPGAKIDGVCTWLDSHSPVIGMSTLHDRLDNFWFVLRHEIEHVLEGHGKCSIGMIDNFSEDREEDEEERLANAAASDFCIPTKKMDSFYARKFPYFSERDVIGFAAVMEVHPAIVIGQLQKKMNRYDYLRKHQTPIRKYVASSAVTDGWGTVAEAQL